MRKLNQIWYILFGIFLSIITFTHNCYATGFIKKLFDREIDPIEAAILICSVLAIFISPQKYRTKLAGIVIAVTVIYFMIIVINMSSDIELR